MPNPKTPDRCPVCERTEQLAKIDNDDDLFFAARQWAREADELQADNARLQAMVDRSGLDTLACRSCGEAMLAYPEGMQPLCTTCEAAEAEGGGG